MAVGEVWHEFHVYHEAVKVVCSNMLGWNGYRQDHASGGDIVIIQKVPSCQGGNHGAGPRASTDASGKRLVLL